MQNIVFQHIQEIQNLWLLVDQRQHDHSKGILKLGMLIQLV